MLHNAVAQLANYSRLNASRCAVNVQSSQSTYNVELSFFNILNCRFFISFHSFTFFVIGEALCTVHKAMERERDSNDQCNRCYAKCLHWIDALLGALSRRWHVSLCINDSMRHHLLPVFTVTIPHRMRSDENDSCQFYSKRKEKNHINNESMEISINALNDGFTHCDR